MNPVKDWGEKLRSNLSSVILGKDKELNQLITALLCHGHILLEDVPGVGKTILARSLAISLGGAFRRVQSTPDILPSDLIGVSIYHKQLGKFRFHQGPLFSDVLLVDEINRANPRTQSALLEAMGSGTVSVEGHQRELSPSFFLIATQNPVEYEGTFPLPEAQKDRFFMCLSLGYPDRKTEGDILSAQNRSGHPVEDLKSVTSQKEILSMQEMVQNVEVSDEIVNRIMGIVKRSRIDTRLECGISTRGAKALYKGTQATAALMGRKSANESDLTAVMQPILKKRMTLLPEAALHRESVNHIVDDLYNESLSYRGESA